MTDQPALFDASQTSPTPCPVNGCGAIKFPNQDRVPTCACDKERALAGYTPRPTGCLNAINPAHTGIPY